MKKILFCLLLVSIASCKSDDDAIVGIQPPYVIPTASEFQIMQDSALVNRTQHFTLNATAADTITFTSAQGVIVKIPPMSLEIGGSPVTGAFNMDYVELYNAKDMVATNRPTMGIMPNGGQAFLSSGGALYFNATQNGMAITLTNRMLAQIPAALTDAQPAVGMQAWTGEVTGRNFAWALNDNPDGGSFVTIDEANYYFLISNFGWANVDMFYSDPRPKTTLLAAVPEGYNFSNSAMYISYDGQPNGLAKFDHVTTEGLFSEHYGQIPIGLACHIIFVTGKEGTYRYAIKALTITQGEIITFANSDLLVGNEAQLTTAITVVRS